MASSSSSSSSLDSEWKKLRILTFRHIGDDVLHGSVLLRHRDRRYTVEILASTGQVISWKNKNGEEMLFVSDKSVIKKDEPIRGGILVCFPRFINNGNIENTFPSGWILDYSVPQSDYKPILAFILGPSNNRDSLNWPNKFEFRIKYHLLEENGTLEMESRIENTDDKPFTFQFCYQNYLAASDIGNIQIGGLDKLEYLDYQNDKNRVTEHNDKVAFRSEVDRVYVDVPAGGNNRVINVVDHAKRRIYTIERSGTSLPDIVVWNPWIEKAKTIGDMGDEEYKKMACVGPAAVVDPVTLNPGEAWTGKQSISIHEIVQHAC